VHVSSALSLVYSSQCTCSVGSVRCTVYSVQIYTVQFFWVQPPFAKFSTPHTVLYTVNMHQYSVDVDEVV
jgi:hypothetical protein